MAADRRGAECPAISLEIREVNSPGANLILSRFTVPETWLVLIAERIKRVRSAPHGANNEYGRSIL